jgi:alcohol dehydrogenase (cytochrome c)
MAIDAKTRQATLEDHGRIPAGDAAHRLLRDHPRGAAIYDGKIFRTTLDAVIALDAKTSKELWRKNAIDFKTGSFVDGWDPQRGEHLWRTYKIPGPGEPGRDTWTGDTWKNGGGSPGSPARSIPSCTPCTGASAIRVRSMPPARPRDNLYTCSVLALDPKTGKIKWHNQFSPNNPFD